MEDVIYKYGKDITWSLPILFQYEPIWGAIYKRFQYYGINLPEVNVFGSPATAWTGGRTPEFCGQLDKKNLDKIFSYMKSVNAIPSLTFTYTGLTKEDLKDTYANYFLDVALEHDCHFIVYSDLLKNHIKEKKSNAYVVASVIKPTIKFHGYENMKEWSFEKETQYYNDLLKEYDMVVVRPEYSKNYLVENSHLINDISRIEVLINQHCIQNCPLAPEHYRTIDKTRLGVNSEFKCYKFSNSINTLAFKNTVSHNEKVVKKLVEKGTRHLKLQGRSTGNHAQSHALMLFAQMFDVTGSNHLIVEDIMHGTIEYEIDQFNNYMKN